MFSEKKPVKNNDPMRLNYEEKNEPTRLGRIILREAGDRRQSKVSISSMVSQTRDFGLRDFLALRQFI
jgi:hypothetical protein